MWLFFALSLNQEAENQNACPSSIPFVKLSNAMESQKNFLEKCSHLSSNSLIQWGGGGRLKKGVSRLWLLLIVLLGSNALASDSEDYDFSWLDPDKKIYVLQNRKYRKANRPVAFVMGGVGMSNPYKSSLNLDGRLAYYVSELFGIEGFYTLTSNSSNTTLKALETASPNALPKVRQIDSLAGGMIHFVPWYAKINVFNRILYFDWYFGAGLGIINTSVNTRERVSQSESLQKQNFTALMFSTGHQYYINDHFIARIDLAGAFYKAPINGLTGESSWYSNYNFALGIGWRM